MKKAVSGRMPYAPAPEREGLNPREALDILEARARESQTIISSAMPMSARRCSSISPNMARPPPVRPSPPTSPRPARVNRLLADDDDDEVRAELAVKIARLMPGLAARESDEIVALTIATLEAAGAGFRGQGARHPGRRDQASGLHSPHDVALALAR